MVAPPRRLERSRCGAVGMLVQGLRHVGRAVEHRAALALDQRERLAGVEVLLQHDAAGVRHDVEERVLAAEPPEERHGEPQPVALGDLLPLADLPHVLDQRVVLELHALRQGGRARGVQEVGDVLRPDRALRGVDRGFGHRRAERREVGVLQPAGGQLVAEPDDPFDERQLQRREQRTVVVLQEAVGGDQEPGVGVAEHVLQLARGRPGVDPDHHAAEQRDREVGDQPLGPVAHQDRDLVAAADAEGVEPARDPPHLGAELAIGVALAGSDERLAVGEVRGELVDQVRDGPARRLRRHGRLLTRARAGARSARRRASR